MELFWGIAIMTAIIIVFVAIMIVQVTLWASSEKDRDNHGSGYEDPNDE